MQQGGVSSQEKGRKRGVSRGMTWVQGYVLVIISSGCFQESEKMLLEEVVLKEFSREMGQWGSCLPCFAHADNFVPGTEPYQECCMSTELGVNREHCRVCPQTKTNYIKEFSLPYSIKEKRQPSCEGEEGIREQMVSQTWLARLTECDPGTGNLYRLLFGT